MWIIGMMMMIGAAVWRFLSQCLGLSFSILMDKKMPIPMRTATVASRGSPVKPLDEEKLPGLFVFLPCPFVPVFVDRHLGPWRRRWRIAKKPGGGIDDRTSKGFSICSPQRFCLATQKRPAGRILGKAIELPKKQRQR